MLKEATGTLKSVSSQASGLQAQVVQAQMQSEAKMAKQKAAFEEKLKAQEQGNEIKINNKIKRLQSGNADLKKQAREIEAANRVMRKQLHALQAHVGVAKDFTDKSLTATDDKSSALLQVLRDGARRHRHHAFVETSSSSRRDVDEDGDDEDSTDSSDGGEESSEDEDSDSGEEPSFLTLSMKVRRASLAESASSSEAVVSDLESFVPAVPSLEVDTPATGSSDDLLEVLAKDVARLSQQVKESEKKMKQLFVRDYRAGLARHKTLLALKKSLSADRSSLMNTQAQLKAAEAHVEGTRAKLEAELRGLGQYLQKLAHFAMAPEREVPHLLEVLPKAVAVKASSAA